MNKTATAIERFSNMTPQLQEKYKINRAVTLEEIGEFLNESMDDLCEENSEHALANLRVGINSMHMRLFPNAWTEETTHHRIDRIISEAIYEINSGKLDVGNITFLLNEARGWLSKGCQVL
jgi:hypothetical protein